MALSIVFFAAGQLQLVFDFCAGGDLFDYLDSCGVVLDDPEAGHFMVQLLAAVSFLHDRSVVHCDVKPENIFLETPGPWSRIKLGDFGSARPCAAGSW